MKTVRAAGWFRCWVVMVTIVSWFVLSNHCALGGMTERCSSGAHSCCAKAMESKGDVPVGGAVMECCKNMHAQIPDSLSVAPPTVWPGYLPFLVASLSFESTQYPTAGSVCGFPPEHPPSLVELLLQKSLHAHAPPSTL